MTVVIIDVFGLNGGAEKVMLNTYNSLKQKNRVICYLPKGSFITSHIEEKDLFEFSSIGEIIGLIKKHDPSKIILNNKASLKLLIPLKLSCWNAKYYYHSHGYFRNILEKLIYTFFFLPLLTKTICVSKSVVKNHNSLTFKKEKHILLYNGFNFSTVKKRDSDNSFINIFFWAQFREWKGHLFLLEIIRKVKNPRVKFNFVASIQDNESKNLLKSVKEKIFDYNIEHKINFYLNCPDYLDIINSNADISLSCSQLKDPLPTIIIESLSMGIPILATNIGGSSEILKEYPEMLSGSSEKDFLKNLNSLIHSYDQINKEDLKTLYKDKFSLNRYSNSINEIINT